MFWALTGGRRFWRLVFILAQLLFEWGLVGVGNMSARPHRAYPALQSVFWASLARAPFAERKGRGLVVGEGVGWWGCSSLRNLWSVSAKWSGSAIAVNFLTWVLPLLNAWFKRHDEVQSVTFTPAGFRSNRESHVEFERVVPTISGVAE